ncbi:hypothetical protein AALH12_03110 [Streptococcus ferus]|uniref:hypothetical protein n=1 Tax=Streptococcus ferus TaxID=1345 RepID=UPI003514A48F
MTKGLKLGFVIVIGGIIMTLLSGCDKRNNREWLENKFGTELSRVYPTQNVEDLFKEFPDGFRIEQTHTDGDYDYEIELSGDSDTRSIKGTLTQINQGTGEKITTIYVEYKDKKFVFSDEAKAKIFWPYEGFLFQQLAVKKSFLNRLDMTDKHYNFQNGAFGIDYDIVDKMINNYLNEPKNKELKFRLGGSNSNRGYYYSVIFEDKANENYYFRETIAGTPK